MLSILELKISEKNFLKDTHWKKSTNYITLWLDNLKKPASRHSNNQF